MTKYLIVQEIRLNFCNHEIRLICMPAFVILILLTLKFDELLQITLQ